MFKKIVSILAIMCFICTTTVYAETIRIDKFKGLQRNPKADRIEDGAHDRFDNVYLRYGNVDVVKGRDRLNTTAHADTVVNGSWYYENAAGTTKKIVVAESDELVTYDTDGTNRTQIAGPALTNEHWTATRAGDTLYLTSTTNGIYKWAGTGSATAVGSVSASSSVDFSATTGNGGLTSGLPSIVNHEISIDTGRFWRGTTGTGACVAGETYVTDDTEDNTACGSLSASFTKTCATTSIYSYKITKFSTTTGIESEASTLDTATLTGANTVNVTGRNCYLSWSDSGCTTGTNTRCGDTVINITGQQTRTTGTIAAAPSAPFDKYLIYRTVAGGSDFFLLGVADPGTTYTDGKPDVVLGRPLDTTIHTIAPPAFPLIEEYKGVLFVAENNIIKFNHTAVDLVADADTYWLDTDELQVNGNITALKKASDSLIIFTDKDIYQLTGFGASSFRLIPLVSGIGSVNQDTIELDTNGDLIFFSGTSGVYKLTIGSQQTDNLTGAIVDRARAGLVKVSGPFLDNVFRGEDSDLVLSPTNYAASHSYYDSDNDYYFLYIGTHCLMFDATSSTWSHIPATSMLSSVWRKSPNAAGVGVLIDNLGFFFNNWAGYENGIQSGTVTGLATSSTNSTITCSGCTFNTTGDGLKGLWIYLANSPGEYHQVASNTATVITITDTWSTNPIISDNFYVAYIVAKWRTKQYSFIRPPEESKLTIFYVNHNLADSSQPLDIFSFQEKITNEVNEQTIDLSDRLVNSINTRMRSAWMQWSFRSYVYNISNTINPPIDIVSYAVEAEQEQRLNNDNG